MSGLARKLQIFEEVLFYIAKEKRLKLEQNTEAVQRELIRVDCIINDLFEEHERIKV